MLSLLNILPTSFTLFLTIIADIEAYIAAQLISELLSFKRLPPVNHAPTQVQQQPHHNRALAAPQIGWWHAIFRISIEISNHWPDRFQVCRTRRAPYL